MNPLLAQLKHLFSTYRQFAMFILVGIINTIFGYSVFAFLIFIQLHYSIAVFLTTCFGILFNFITTGTIVFQNNDKKLIFQFVAVCAFVYCLTLLFIKEVRLIGITNIYISGAIVSLITPFISYYLNKRYVFTKPKNFQNGEYIQ